MGREGQGAEGGTLRHPDRAADAAGQTSRDGEPKGSVRAENAGGAGGGQGPVSGGNPGAHGGAGALRRRPAEVAG